MEFIAHRGNNGNGFRENSVSAFVNCFNTSYISGVEMDVRLTCDNVVVISHGDIVNGKVISKCKYSKVKNLVDRLDNVLYVLSSKKKIIIDVKGDDDKIVYFLYDIIKKYKYQFYICSFSYSIVSLFKERYPSYTVGLIIGYMVNFDKIYNSFDFNLIHYNLVKRIGNKESYVWTVNDKFIYNVVKKYCSFVITDKAYLLHE